MTVDGVLGNLQAPGDLLRVKMLGDEPEALTLAWRKSFNRVRIVMLPHERRSKASFRVSSIG
jgi:hypothetical protein